jgi:hypothetical protein
MIARRDQTAGVFAASAPKITVWEHTKSRHWAHISLHRASAMPTMASTWVPELSFTMSPSHVTGTGDQCKRFLWRASPTDIRCGSGPQGPMPCRVERSFGGRVCDSERTAIAC